MASGASVSAFSSVTVSHTSIAFNDNLGFIQWTTEQLDLFATLFKRQLDARRIQKIYKNLVRHACTEQEGESLPLSLAVMF